MAFAIKHIRQRIEDKWLVGHDTEKVLDLFQQAETQLANISDLKTKPVLICENDPLLFTTAFFSSLKAGANIFLGNPSWGARDWDACSKQINPEVSFGDHQITTNTAPPFPGKLKEQIGIPTGGTGGVLKFALHTWKTLSASAKASNQFFELKQSDVCCTLPLCHVSGLMQLIRSFQSGGHILFTDWKEIENGYYPKTDDYQISLVPTQLERLLKKREAVNWLREFSIIYLGGGPANPDTIKEARTMKLPIASVYGMTETAAMTAAQLPDEFLAGQSISGSPLPHASIQIVNEEGNALPDGRYGNIRIESSSLFKGYFHERLSGDKIKKIKYFDTDDEGSRDESGRLYVRGRLDRIIISGGKKIDPAIIEQILMETGLIREIKVLGLNNKEWGQMSAAVYAAAESIPEEKLIQAAGDKLPSWMIPKLWLQTEKIPVDEKGKISHKHLQSLFRL